MREDDCDMSASKSRISMKTRAMNDYATCAATEVVTMWHKACEWYVSPPLLNMALFFSRRSLPEASRALLHTGEGHHLDKTSSIKLHPTNLHKSLDFRLLSTVYTLMTLFADTTSFT